LVNKPDFDIEVTDKAMLARCHYPELCDVKPKMREIKAALNSGRTIYGVKATPKIKSSVRLSPQPKMIEA